jgi:hypothetical protein
VKSAPTNQLPAGPLTSAVQTAPTVRPEIVRVVGLSAKTLRFWAARRRGVLTGEAPPEGWRRDPERHFALVRAAGEEAVDRAERRITLFHVDRAWWGLVDRLFGKRATRGPGPGGGEGR